MADRDSKDGHKILTGDDLTMIRSSDDLKMIRGITRREFIRYSAVADGTPAAKSRAYSIAAQQIVQTDVIPNTPNVRTAYGVYPVDSMDPTRLQDDKPDPSIVYGSVPDVPYCASYNAELFKQPSPQMIAELKTMFPAVAG